MSPNTPPTLEADYDRMKKEGPFEYPWAADHVAMMATGKKANRQGVQAIGKEDNQKD